MPPRQDPLALQKCQGELKALKAMLAKNTMDGAKKRAKLEKDLVNLRREYVDLQQKSSARIAAHDAVDAKVEELTTALNTKDAALKRAESEYLVKLDHGGIEECRAGCKAQNGGI
jgi:predicted RNase H-like nuclease